MYTIHRQHGAQATMCTENTNKNRVTIAFSKIRKHERSTSKTFVIRILLDYKNFKRARQSRRRVVRIQSALREVACAQNSRGLKITVVKIYRTVVRA